MYVDASVASVAGVKAAQHFDGCCLFRATRSRAGDQAIMVSVCVGAVASRGSANAGASVGEGCYLWLICITTQSAAAV
jgi:hypothetical protein